MRKLLTFVFLGLIAVAFPLSASEFRQFNSISHPAPLPNGAQKLETFKPVDRSLVEGALKQVIASWNTPALESKLADDFHNKERLVNEVSSYATRSTGLRLVSVQNVRTLQQYTLDNTLVSRVSVTAVTQIEFVHPTQGVQEKKGTNEYILRITQPLVAGKS